MNKLRENQAVRDIALGLVASAIWVVASQGVGGIIDRPVLLFPTFLLVFVSSVALVRATRAERRLRRLVADLSSEPSASKAGDRAVQLLKCLVTANRLDADRLADLTQRRRHPLSGFLDGLDAVMARGAGDLSQTGGGPGGSRSAGMEQALDYLADVQAGKIASRDRAIKQAAEHLRGLLQPGSMLLLYGYSTVVCDAVRAAAPSVPVYVVRDVQYGTRSSVGEHTFVQRRLAERGIESTLIDTDQVTTLLDPHSYRLKALDGTSGPLPDEREVVAVIGCEAADRSGRVFIPATVRGQPSETAWFVAEFARARQRGEGASISAQLVVIGESFKVFDDLALRPELRTTSAPVPVSRFRRWAHVYAAVDLPRGVPVELLEIGPDHIDLYVDDAVVARTRRGALKLDASHDAWSRRVGIVRAPASVTPGDLAQALAQCRLIFIDFNGVLVDDEVDHFCAFAALSRATTDRSLPIDVYLTTCAGRTDVEGVDELRAAGFVAGDTDDLVVRSRTSTGATRLSGATRTGSGCIGCSVGLATWHPWCSSPPAIGPRWSQRWVTPMSSTTTSARSAGCSTSRASRGCR